MEPTDQSHVKRKAKRGKDDTARLRSAFRDHLAPVNRINFTGMRIARNH